MLLQEFLIHNLLVLPKETITQGGNDTKFYSEI